MLSAPVERVIKKGPARGGADGQVEDGQAEGRNRSATRSFGWLAALGVILVLAGLVGLIYTGVATLTSMILFGWLLLIGGVVGLLHAIQARGTSFLWLGAVVAALNIAAGVVVIQRPDAAGSA
jgi:uncharacterized membrane protein HdeD (DUF308 family)